MLDGGEESFLWSSVRAGKYARHEMRHEIESVDHICIAD